MIIPQDKVDKVALTHAREYIDYDEENSITEEDLMEYSQFDFKAGVKFAESELEELSVEFGEWLQNYEEPIYNIRQLFQQFLNSRNENKV